MSKAFIILFILSIFCLFFNLRPVYANVVSLDINPTTINYGDQPTVTIQNIPNTVSGNNFINVAMTIKPAQAAATGGNIRGSVVITVNNGNCSVIDQSSIFTSKNCVDQGSSFNFSGQLDTTKIGADQSSTLSQGVVLYIGQATGSNPDPTCQANFGVACVAGVSFTINPTSTPAAGSFSIDSITPNPVAPGNNVAINLSNTISGNYAAGVEGSQLQQVGNCAGGACSLTITVPSGTSSPTVTVIVADPNGNELSSQLTINLPVPITNQTQVTQATNSDSSSCTSNDPNCTSASNTTCSPGNNTPDAVANPQAGGVWTAIGCIPTNPPDLIKSLLSLALYASGGIALLLMAFGAIEMITSGGNAEALKNGQGRFTSAIIGLLFVIFSVFLLKVIGVDILNLPGFGAV